MADKRISELNQLTSAAPLDEFAIVDVNEPNVDIRTKRITFSDMMASPGPIGATDSDSAVFTTLELQSGVLVNNISSNVLLGNSNQTIPTQRAVKTYVDSQLAINVRRVFSDTTAVAHDVLLVDTTNGDVTIEVLDTLDGKVNIKKIAGSNDVIITAPATIDGQAQLTMTTQFQSYQILIDSGEFFVI